MQNLTSIRRLRLIVLTNKIKLNNQFLIKSQIKAFATLTEESRFNIPNISQIGKEFKNNRDRIDSAVKPKTLSEIKKIQNFIKTTNAENNLEE